MDEVVLLAACLTPPGRGQINVKHELGRGRTDADARDERRLRGPDDAEVRERDVGAERIRDEVDGMTQLGQRLDAMVLAERCAARLEERLRREHENPHSVCYPVFPAARGSRQPRRLFNSTA